MRAFWKPRNEFDQLERELLHKRPRPRSEYLESLATQLSAKQVSSSSRPAFRYRVTVAVAMTGLLGVVGAASGGLNYANTASSHTLKAVTQVFSSPSTSSPANHDAASSASDARQSDQGDSNLGSNDNRDRGSDHNAAHHQYVEFVFVCLRVPPKHPFIFITLRLPRVAALQLIARGTATLGPC